MTIRNLTPEEIQDILSQRVYGNWSGTPQLKAIRELQLGNGILISHGNLKCSGKNRNCGLFHIAGRVGRERPACRFKVVHTNGPGSDAMVICVAREP